MVINEEDVRAQLRRILSSETFTSSARSSEFLTYCVDQTLDGKVDELKESTLGVAVFGRSPDYDPKADAIVRVHARRLRDKLDEYYRAFGPEDPIEISIPKGRYVPSIAIRKLLTPTLPLDPLQAVHNPIANDAPHGNASTSRVPWRWMSVSAFLLAMLLLVIFAERRQATPTLQGGDPTPFASLPGFETSPAWAPDGKTMAYLWDEGTGNTAHVFLHRVGEAQPHRLTSTNAEEFRPVFSPDGTQIAFLRGATPNHFQLIKRRLSDGAEINLGEFTFYSLGLGSPALDWSPNSKEFLVSDQPTSSSPVHLDIVNASTGKTTPLTQPVYGTSGDFEAKFSPDGTVIAFRRGGLGDLYTVTVMGESSVPLRRLTNDSIGVRGISWSSDGRSLLFGRRGKNGKYALWKIGADGGTLTPFSALDVQSTDPATSRDGRFIAFERHDLVINLAEQSLAFPGHKTYLSPSNEIDGAPSFSPNGRSLAFMSTRGGSNEIWLQSNEGGSLKQITHFDGERMPIGANWSPDGKSLIITARAGGATNLYLYSIDDDAMRQITFGSARIVSPLFSRDGRYIYFSSNVQGANRIWRMASDGSGHAEQMYGDVAIFFQQSTDGRYLYFTNENPPLRIMRRDLKAGTLDTIYTSSRSLFSMASFAIQGKVLYMMLATSQGQGADILSLNLASGKSLIVDHLDSESPKFLADVATLVSGFAISPDGRSVVFPEVRHASTDIYSMKAPTP